MTDRPALVEAIVRALQQDWHNSVEDDVTTVARVLAEHETAMELRLMNTEIDRQQALQRMQKAGELLTGLTWWPSPMADQNMAHDIGRVLLGQGAERSEGVQEAIDAATPFAMSWKQRAEAAEARCVQLDDECERLGGDVRRLELAVEGERAFGQQAEARCAQLEQELRLNAHMLAKQCDLAREAETQLASLQAEHERLQKAFAEHTVQCQQILHAVHAALVQAREAP